MTRVLGIDPGTVTLDVCGLEDGRVFLHRSFATAQALQDPQSLLDVICPMAYTTEPDIFQKQIAAARDYAGSRPVWAGIGAYKLSPAQTLTHIAAANKLGVAGIILFSYESLAAPPNGAESVSELGRAAFGTAPE